MHSLPAARRERVSVSPAMEETKPFDELLSILVCPKSKGDLELVSLPESLCSLLRDRYRENFQNEEPVVAQGLLCRKSELVYPIVSDIPILLIDDAVPAADLEEG